MVTKEVIDQFKKAVKNEQNLSIVDIKYNEKYYHAIFCAKQNKYHFFSQWLYDVEIYGDEYTRYKDFDSFIADILEDDFFGENGWEIENN